MKFALAAAMFMSQLFGQVVITNSGSTNRAGMTVTLEAKGHAAIEGQGGAKATMSVHSELHSRFMKDLEAAGPLDQMNVRHCAKSVSFGSSTFVTHNGVRSPDISCAGQTDPAVIALQKDVDEIMSQAKAKMPAQRRFPQVAK